MADREPDQDPAGRSDERPDLDGNETVSTEFGDHDRTVPPGQPANAPSKQDPDLAPDGVPTEFGEEICPLEPGARCGGRYRILEKVGAGGMGEVWRARDEALKQVVALKFLGGTYLERQREGLEILRNEVRLAWRVSHPNVCRVHDLGEVGGKTFLSMEFIDGESLDRLLTRIGRPSPEKAREMARQMVAGVQAAHAKGVLHRDLKPGNIMLDGRGQVRITDFGIAGDLGSGDGKAAGSPAYMAPELFEGAEPTVQSDLYALGLILFELFTGERAFRASSLEELLQQHRRAMPLPSDLVPNIDPVIESVILDCMAKDPSDRPESAFEVLSRLSGSNLLDEMIRAGQTPSTDMVAAGDSRDRYHAKIASLILCSFVVCMIGVFVFEPDVKLASYAWLPESGEVLAADGRRHLAEMGFDAGEDQAWAFDVNSPWIGEIYLQWKRGVDGEAEIGSVARSGARDFDQLREETTLKPAIDFWYRTSPEPLGTEKLSGIVSWSDPPLDQPGMTRMRLAPDGSLRAFDRVSPLVIEMASASPDADAVGDGERSERDRERAIEALFEVVRLPRAEFSDRHADGTPVESEVRPVVYADATSAWLSKDGGDVRIEAAFLGDEIVSVRVFEGDPEWQVKASQPDRERPTNSLAAMSVFRAIFSIAAAILAWRTLKRGGGDRGGAFRIGLAIFVLVLLYTLLTGHHPRGLGSSGDLVLRGMARALLVSIQYGLFYFALEPVVRRVWPQMLVPWYRLLRGEWRDPAVGFSVLTGVAGAAFATVMVYVARVAPTWFGAPGAPPLIPYARTMEVLRGGTDSVGALLEVVVSWIDVGMGAVMGLVLLRMLTRSRTWSVGIMTVVMMGLWVSGFTGVNVFVALALISVSVMSILLAVRVGMLALLVALCAYQALTIFPLRTDLSHWHGASTLILVVLLSGAMVYGLIASLSGRSSVRSATERRVVGLGRVSGR